MRIFADLSFGLSEVAANRALSEGKAKYAETIDVQKLKESRGFHS